MLINTITQTEAYKTWYDYYYCQNSKGTSEEVITEICNTYKAQIKNWKVIASTDENQYIISDDKLGRSKEKGNDDAANKTGYKNSTGQKVVQHTRAIGDAAAGVAGALAVTVGNKVANKLAKKVVGDAAQKAANKAIDKAMNKAMTKGEEMITKEAEEEIVKKSSKTAGKSIGFILSATLAAAEAAMYMVKKPNKEQKEACDALQEEQRDAQGRLIDAQDQIHQASEDSESLAEEAEANNEDAADRIDEEKTTFDLNRIMLNALRAKANSGNQLTQNEHDSMNKLVSSLQNSKISIKNIQGETKESNDEIKDEQLDMQSEFDSAAATMGEVQGLTDYAESLDEMTRTLCYVEAAAQQLNAISGAKAAWQAGSFALSGGIFTAWAWPFAAMGTYAASVSEVGAFEQCSFAKHIGEEIELREYTQNLNSESQEIYDDEIEMYEGVIDIVDKLELPEPDDLEIPEDINVLTDTTTPDNNQNQHPSPVLGLVDDDNSYIKKNV